jgi:hypothetical protein
MLFDPIRDALRRFGGDHFGAPRSRINVAMTAGLVAFPTNINLKRLDARAPKHHIILSELLVETIHLLRHSLPRGTVGRRRISKLPVEVAVKRVWPQIG